jgi:uncharacterized 2Fe-2S/4Fe-4S cluster protein (DUF4445 family)
MTGSPDPLVIFTPSGRRGRFPAGTSVLDAARSLGVDIDSVCGGRGICGRCQVEQSVGAFPKHGITSLPAHLTAPDAVERAYAGRRGLADNRRLSCAVAIAGDAVIDVPAGSQVHRQVVRKELEVRPFDLDPVVRLHYVEAAPPDLASPASDLVRVMDALEREWGLRGLEANLATTRALQEAVLEGNGAVTVAVHGGRSMIAAWPGFRDRAFGVAVDIGSTTIAGHLASLLDGTVLASAGTMNPQIRFGEDLMSRVSYAMLHTGGAADMTRAVRAALRELIAELAEAAGVATGEVVATGEILEIVLVGNPIMHHLVLGLDPTPLGQAPFTLATERAVHATAAELELDVHPGARVYVLPCIAGHVGADTAGVILAEQPHRSDTLRLIVDVGTNAEIVLGNRTRLLAASSPTGPAFEGAQISAGQRAAPGAIERVRIDPSTLAPRYRVIGCGLWSDEPGFADATRETGVTGICGSGIIEAIAELFLAGVITADGILDGRVAGRTADRTAEVGRTPRLVEDGRTFAYVLADGPPRITITQGDVRAIQLAKAALYAGARLLMDAYGVDAVDEIRLAGAFGSHIDVKHAMVLGLVPDCDLDRVASAGNAAGAGALIALLSGAARAEIEDVVRRVTKLETAIEPRFQEHFVEALAIPHRTAPYPNLARVVELPERPEAGRAGQDERTERRRRRMPVAAHEEDR